jgi:hypothetical protein
VRCFCERRCVLLSADCCYIAMVPQSQIPHRSATLVFVWIRGACQHKGHSWFPSVHNSTSPRPPPPLVHVPQQIDQSGTLLPGSTDCQLPTTGNGSSYVQARLRMNSLYNTVLVDKDSFWWVKAATWLSCCPRGFTPTFHPKVLPVQPWLSLNLKEG